MKNYLRYFLDLYGDYMGVALVGMLLAALLLSSLSAVRSGNVVWAIVGLLVLYVAVHIGVNFVRNSYRSWKEERFSLQQQRGALALNELVQLEQEAHHQRNEERLAEARKYLRFLNARGIRDYRGTEDERLVNDVVELLQELHGENVSEASISRAVDKFVTSMERGGENVLFPADRSRIIGSIVSDAVLNENRESEGKFAS